ncbi:amino acid adenylation domain-containing protein, partial [Flavobacterium sp. LC2016-23]|uniref:non-ribosomal peptide synthetase n=1 Tax=Flavobacterium sp. LC2016-23 TaxID=2666330 RepID=UPI0012AF30B5
MDNSTMQNNFYLVTKYWKKKIADREQVAAVGGRQNNLPCVTIEAGDLHYFNKLTNGNTIAKATVLSAIYSFLLKKLMADFDGYIVSDYKEPSHPMLLSFPVDLNVSFKEYLQKVKSEILETLQYSDYTNDDLSEKTRFSDLSIFSNYSIGINSVNGLACKGILFHLKTEENGAITINVSYLENFAKKTLANYLLQHFKQFIADLENNIATNLADYELLSDTEKQQLLVDFNATDVAYPKEKTIVDLFEEQVAKTPDNVAVVCKESNLTYSELNKKANQLAHYISSNYSLNKGDIVGVFLPKSDNGIISLLAILKLGAVYLPIDTHYPQERIDYLIKDSGLKLLITDSVTDLHNCKTVALQSVNFDRNSDENINTVISPKDLAYVIYTSGSTGQPKGVLIEHTSNINMSLDQISFFDVRKEDKIVWFASVAFDASISEIMMSLYSGATLCIPTEEVIKDKDLFVSFLKETKATVVTFPPSYLGLLSEQDISGLRCVITAGEPANPTKAIAVVQSGIDYYNAYGPTECAVCVSIYKLSENDFDKTVIPIGKPISNTKIYILDEAFKPVPIGVAGKIYVSGAGVGRGYLNKPELTQEKFIANPFQAGERLYDTGDLGCWLSDGNIEFLGRKDFQVKIRGYRIELGEIENTILKYSDDLKQVVVEVKENNQEKVLAAYLVSTAPVDKSELRSFLQHALPDYLVPGFYIVLDKLPLTPNGKIDRKALPGITNADVIRKAYAAPQNETEKSLVAIWQEVLGLEKIGITDNFFELGGHSLIIAQVINRTHKQLGKTVSFKTFFTSPTIAALSRQLQENDYQAIPEAPEANSYPVTASQKRLWILSQLEGGSLAYNMPATVKLTGTVDVQKFEESFKLLIHRHEILRTCFKATADGEVQQYIIPAGQVKFTIAEKDFSSTENKHEAIADYLQNTNSHPFNLETAPLVRASLIKLEENESVFFLSLHHIIGDGWSIELLIAEVVKTYNTLLQGKEITFPELSIQYKDYAVWLHDELQNEKQQQSKEYWLEQFTGELPVLDLPGFNARPLVQTYNGDSVSHQFSNAFLEQLKLFSKEHDVTLFMTLMAGINALLHRYTGQNDIILGTPIAGREHPDLENQMGLYLNTLAIRTQLKEENTFLDVLKLQKETLLSAYDHQSYPFDELVGKLNLKRDTSRSVLFDVLVVLQNQEQLNNLNTEELLDLEVSTYEFKSKTAQFDVSFIFVENEGLDLRIEYNTDIYESDLIERMFCHFENLMLQTVAQPEIQIQEVDFLTQEEKNQLLFDLNNTAIEYPAGKTVLDLFEEQVAKTPNNIAIVFEETQLTYKELD